VAPGRHPGLHVAEAAAAGADVAEDHEGRRPALPALTDVRAVRLLADRVQALPSDLGLEPAVGRATGRRHLQPGRLAGAPERDRSVALSLGPAGSGARAGHVDPL